MAENKLFEWDKEPEIAVISVGVSVVTEVVNFCSRISCPLLNVHENDFNLKELLLFCKDKDIISVLIDLNKPHLFKVLEIIANNTESNTTLVCVVSETFADDELVNLINKKFHVIFSSDDMINFHNPIKVLYSMFDSGFVGMDYRDSIYFLKNTSFVKYMHEGHVTENNLDVVCSKLKDKIHAIRTTFSTESDGALFLVMEGNVNFSIFFLSECAEALVSPNVVGKCFLVNAVVDEQRINEGYDIHLLVGIK